MRKEHVERLQIAIRHCCLPGAWREGGQLHNEVFEGVSEHGHLMIKWHSGTWWCQGKVAMQVHIQLIASQDTARRDGAQDACASIPIPALSFGRKSLPSQALAIRGPPERVSAPDRKHSCQTLKYSWLLKGISNFAKLKDGIGFKCFWVFLNHLAFSTRMLSMI